MAPASSTITNRLKVQLKLSIARLRMVQQRDEALSKQQRRAIAQILEAGKIESAKIRVENIIRSDVTTELHEILELYCELLLARIRLLEGSSCDIGLEEAVKSLIHAAPRTDVKELQQVRVLLCEKYGKEFALSAIENTDSKVSEKVLKKLDITPPVAELVNGYLEEIARTYGVDWPKRSVDDGIPLPVHSDESEDDEPPSHADQHQNMVETPVALVDDAGAELGRALSPPRSLGPSSPLRVTPPGPRTDNPHPCIKGTSDLKLTQQVQNVGFRAKTSGTNRKDPTTGSIPDVDELAARFAALKK
ncbi:BgTH12-01460 [Blumeria graminis f. sp. triticale]|nr:BgTH12-01460 [Blumeria graminis f. sp. triticale]